MNFLQTCFKTLRRKRLTTTTSLCQNQSQYFSTKKEKEILRPLYLDFQATSPIDFRVVDAMMPFMTSNFGNPHSRTHQYGWASQQAAQKGRAQIAELIGADPQDIIITSGATESNNLALKGLAGFYGKTKNHIITTQIEHKCVLDTCRHLEDQGFKVTYLPVGKDGLVDLNLLQSEITDKTLCVSVIFVNNEIGTKQDVQQIGELCRKKQIFFHTDAAQAVGQVPINVDQLNIDLLSISGHKVYGPKGIGALYLRRQPRVRLTPLINGGGQQRGLRSGTLPTHLVVGFGEACAIAKRELPNDIAHIKRLSNQLIQQLKSRLTHIQINGSEQEQYSYEGCLNISFAYVEGESLIMAIKNCAVSSGSACTSASLEPSYVLRALGVQEDLAHTSIRIGIGRFTTEDEIDYFADLISQSVERLREMSPLWEMVQEGVDLKSIEWSQPH